jgi:hypothetical protein
MLEVLTVLSTRPLDSYPELWPRDRCNNRDGRTRYSMTLITYPADVALGAGNASNWTHTRMREARPPLTDIYLWVATTVLLAIQIPVTCLLLWRLRGGWNQQVALAASLALGVSIINALLYSLGNGLNNVRYALPACVLVYATIIWGNLAWLAAQYWLNKSGIEGGAIAKRWYPLASDAALLTLKDSQSSCSGNL